MEVETIWETKFAIDLMAPPPLPSSTERDGLVCMVFDPKCTTQNVQKLPPFDLSQPRSKICTTHQYIALNIRYHQQLTEKALWSGAAAPTLCGAKTLNLNSMQQTEKLILGNLLRADYFPGGQNSTIKGDNGKDKSLEAVASLDKSKSRKHVLQQDPPQVPAAWPCFYLST
ncbi:protein TIME FOR COFFEE-like isoform X1 [Olea europaea var. sylvestris]|uniref:protein TIME FOR COFFEE-like isoform X1 n=1 Tax=Olea europaea var. sylvestris TaxID=158386 RepID=UPI000C1D375D|nr:protein TIME FOR COFFEE-like isoform X1 [Olea europaea var. sylvestris]